MLCAFEKKLRLPIALLCYTIADRYPRLSAPVSTRISQVFRIHIDIQGTCFLALDLLSTFICRQLLPSACSQGLVYQCWHTRSSRNVIQHNVLCDLLSAWNFGTTVANFVLIGADIEFFNNRLQIIPNYLLVMFGDETEVF
jgi:hypothetical protein